MLALASHCSRWEQLWSSGSREFLLGQNKAPGCSAFIQQPSLHVEYFTHLSQQINWVQTDVRGGKAARPWTSAFFSLTRHQSLRFWMCACSTFHTPLVPCTLFSRIIFFSLSEIKQHNLWPSGQLPHIFVLLSAYRPLFLTIDSPTFDQLFYLSLHRLLITHFPQPRTWEPL